MEGGEPGGSGVGGELGGMGSLHTFANLSGGFPQPGVGAPILQAPITLTPYNPPSASWGKILLVGAGLALAVGAAWWVSGWWGEE